METYIKYTMVFLFFLNIVIFLLSFYWAIKSNKLSLQYKRLLEDQGRVHGFLEFAQYLKIKNPKGGFVSGKKIRENMADKNDTEEIKKVLDEICLLTSKMQKGIISFIVILIVIILNSQLIK